MDLVSPLPLLALTGLIAGFIDAIAGGGGLITLPALALTLGEGAHAIGTNKIPGLVAAVTALLVYGRHGHVDWSRSLVFAGWVGVGALLGSFAGKSLPAWVFQMLLGLTCPLILYVVWRKEAWIDREKPRLEFPDARSRLWWEPLLVLSGIGCGFYDGVWGPGAGTFMFLALLFVVGLPLLTAIAAAKLANSLSAAVALVSYSSSGFVHPQPAMWIACGIAVGAFLGAQHATRLAAQIVRPVLAVVVALLLLKLWLS